MRVLLALITVGITIYAVVDCLRSTDEEVRNLPRPLWLLITLVPLVGGLAWLTFGRPQGGYPVRRTARPLAPDDDPEFLQSLDRTFRERRRQAAEEARRRRREEEAGRQAAEEEARRQAEKEAKNGELRRGGRTGGKPTGGRSGNGQREGGQPNGGPPVTGDQPDTPAPSSSSGPDGDERQTPA